MQNRANESATYALLDVDETLINTDATTLNQALLDSLKKAGIKDLCLFTSMYNWQIELDLDPKTKYGRPQLIAELERQGFTVHKVITPIDVVEGKPGAYYEQKWLPAYNKAKATGSISPEEKDAVDRAMKQHEAMLLKRYEEIEKTKGKEEAREFVQQMKANKGLMYQLVMENLDSLPTNGIAVRSFVYFDDKAEEIKHVNAKHQQRAWDHQPTVPLTAIAVQLRSKTDKPDIPGTDNERKEYSARKAEIEQRYSNKLDEHLKQIGPPEIAKLDTLVKTLNDLPRKYSELGRSSNTKDILALLSEVNVINTDQTLSAKQKLEMITDKVEKAFAKERSHYIKPFFPGGRSKSYDDFAAHINKNPDSHNYARMLALTLREVYALDPKKYSNVSQSNISRILPVDNKIYQEMFAQNVRPEQKQQYDYISKELKRLYNFNDTQVYNAYQGRERLVTTDRVIQLWNETAREANLPKLPDKLISALRDGTPDAKAKAFDHIKNQLEVINQTFNVTNLNRVPNEKINQALTTLENKINGLRDIERLLVELRQPQQEAPKARMR